MKSQTFLILCVIAAVIGLIALFVDQQRGGKADQQRGVGDALLANFPMNEVSSIRISQGDMEVRVERREEGWVVPSRKDYPANFTAVNGLLRKMWELKVVQIVPAEPSAYHRLGLDDSLTTGTASDKPVLMEFLGESQKTLGALMLGKQASTGAPGAFGAGGGRFVRYADGTGPVVVIAESLFEATTNIQEWLDSDFLRLARIKSVSTQGAVKEADWHARREEPNGPFTMVEPRKGEEFDPAKLTGLGSLLTFTQFLDVLPGESSVEVTRMADPRKATITTFDGFTYSLLIGQEDEDANHWIKVAVELELPEARKIDGEESEEQKLANDAAFGEQNKNLQERLEKEKAFEEWYYLLPAAQLGDLLKDRAHFLVEPESESETELSQ